MMLLRITVLFLCSGLVSIQAAESFSHKIIGTDPSLQEGARALLAGDFETGLSLTLDGLNSPLSVRKRASALSNVCAGYLGARQFAKALNACDQALEFNDRNWHVYNNRALALLGVGRIGAAQDDLAKGLALNPDSLTLAKVADLIAEQANSRIIVADRTVEDH